MTEQQHCNQTDDQQFRVTNSEHGFTLASREKGTAVSGEGEKQPGWAAHEPARYQAEPHTRLEISYRFLEVNASGRVAGSGFRWGRGGLELRGGYVVGVVVIAVGTLRLGSGPR